MSDYPDPDEEFELMYGDELELLNEQNYEDEEINILPTPKARKSLDFTTPSKNESNSSKKLIQSSKKADKTVSLDTSFETGFEELKNDENVTQSLFSSTTQNLTNQTDLQSKGNDEQEFFNIEQTSSRKRTVNDLFGDIDDIMIDQDFLEVASAPKKHKGNENDKLKEELELIDLIVRKRNEYKLTHNVTSVTISTQKLLDSKERDKRNISYQVPKYPFMRVKSFAGQSIYVRFHSEDYEKDETKRIINENNFQGVMGDSFKKIWRDAQELLRIEPVIEQETETPDIEELNLHNDREKQLWVDLYKPRKYLELLSDESTNRLMLKWMKLWDKVVFNRNPKIKIMPSVPPDNPKKFFQYNELDTKLDEHGRPQHKIALLCGPPGLGKTTLAHMVAKHAGYNVVEINASDDRSIDAFRTALETATQMRSVVDQERRPNCIVFDEIDGAPQSSIDFLVKFVSGTATTTSKKGKNKDKSQNILKRPIICICNDVYVPALRPLRQIAFIIHFPQTSSARLAERLMEIARRQQIKTDLGAMMALAAKSNNDIRSCLSILHFFKAQNKAIGLSDIYKTNVGQKDMQKGLFSVWQDIFEIRRTKKATGGSSIATMKERMQNILSTIGSFGDHERVAQGVYENFPVLNVKNSSLDGTCSALEWFCFNDVIMRQIYAVQDYSLTSYLNYGFVVWHFVFASFQKQKLNYPSAGYEARLKETRQKAIVAEVLRGMSPSVRCYSSALPLVLDVLPLILRIIIPSLRPVSLHLYTEDERRNLLRVAGVMADYNLNYIQERRPDGVYEFNLEPNIEELVIFEKTEPRKVLSYSNKQLIAREIEMEKMRRFESQKAKSCDEIKKNVPEKRVDLQKTNTPRQIAKDVPEKQNQNILVNEKSPNEVALPNHLQTLRAKSLKNKGAKPTLKKDFFGRIIESATATISPSKAKKNLLKNDIWYQYKEGYSNAVRKTIKIKDLK